MGAANKWEKYSEAFQTAQRAVRNLVPQLTDHENEIAKSITALENATPGDPFSLLGDVFFTGNNQRREEAIKDFKRATGVLDFARRGLHEIQNKVDDLRRIARRCPWYLKIVSTHPSTLKSIEMRNFILNGFKTSSSKCCGWIITLICLSGFGVQPILCRKGELNASGLTFELGICACVFVIGGIIAGKKRKHEFEEAKMAAEDTRQKMSESLQKVDEKRVDFDKVFSNIRATLTVANVECGTTSGDIAYALEKMVDSSSQLAGATKVYRSFMKEKMPMNEALFHAVKALPSLDWSEQEKKQLILLEDAIGGTKADVDDVQNTAHSIGIELTSRVTAFFKYRRDFIGDGATTAADSE
eukprot:GEMP01039820.1.p1 GENE.GEMP01039820.1~~GEMP01039820.1.p1  ORF type:complete len:357 (+),score=78.95 GEMP01039820.1:119-1189(+)